jgi:NADH-quinone oxidoreductase subunit L
MVFLVFGGSIGNPHFLGNLRVMQLVLIPLAILGLFGGVLNLPGYLGGGFLSGFFSGLNGGSAAEGSHLQELALQGVAGALALVGLLAAHVRYGAKARSLRLVEARSQASALTAFLLNGWYFDRLYRAVLIRPYRLFSGILWQRVDEGAIDDTLDRLAAGLGSSGSWLGRWSTGRVSIYIFSFAAGGALILGYLAWLTL